MNVRTIAFASAFTFLFAVGTANAQAPSVNEAWTQLKAAAQSDSSENRIQAVTALSVMGNNDAAANILRNAFHDSHTDVRAAAIVAAGETGNKALVPDIQRMLDDDHPQIAFAAALALWKMGDHSGQDIITEVIHGDRKAKPGLIKSSMKKAKHTLHSPEKMLTIGAMQSAGFLFPPAGYGIGAYRYMHSGKTQDPRVQAIEELAKEHSDEVRDELINASDDHDDGVRLAAAEELAKYPGKTTTDALSRMFADSKKDVRLMACAAYIHAGEDTPASAQ